MANSLSPSLHKDPGIRGRRRSYPPVRCRDLGSLSEANQATGAVSPTLLTFHPRHQMARIRVKRRNTQERQPAQNRVRLASGTAALGWQHSQGWKTYACPKQSSPVRSKKEGKTVALQESATEIRWIDSLQRRELAISHGSRRPKTGIAGAHQWEKPVVSSRQRGIKQQRKNARGRKSD